MHISTKKSQTGVGIIELMVAMLVSLLLLNGVIQIYINSKRAYTLTENLSRMQESARFAMGLLAEDLRMAGFIPCGPTLNSTNTLNTGATDMMFNFFGAALMGYEGTANTFPNDFPVVGTAAGERVAGADAIVIISGSGESYKIVNHVGASAQFKLAEIHSLQEGDIVLACNNSNSAVFQITGANNANKTIVHQTGNGVPGNCTKSLGGNGDCANQAGITGTNYDDNSQLVKLESSVYFIGISSSGDSHSLYRTRLVGGGIKQNEELLEGIETMQILYGIDSDNNALADTYLTADAVTTANNWNAVVSVRIGLLATTPEEVHFDLDSKTYNVAGTLIGTSSPVSHDADKRLRYVFSSTIKLRNRGTN